MENVGLVENQLHPLSHQCGLGCNFVARIMTEDTRPRIPDDIMAAAIRSLMVPEPEMVLSVARFLLAERKASREQCAAICDDWIDTFGQAASNLKHTTPKEWANSAVADIAAAIRDEVVPTPPIHAAGAEA